MERVKPFGTKKELVVYIVSNLITVVAIVGCIIYGVTKDVDRFTIVQDVGLCLAAIALYNFPLILRVKFKLSVPPFLHIIYTVFMVAHFVFGEILSFYSYPFLDKLLHTTSGVLYVILAFSIVNGLNNSKKSIYELSPLFVAFFAFCFSLALGYLWEIFEYTVDSIAKSNMQRWQDSFHTIIIDGEERLVSEYGQGSGLIDTMGDLLVNLAGGIAASVLGYIWLKRESDMIEKFLIRKMTVGKEIPLPVIESDSFTEVEPVVSVFSDDSLEEAAATVSKD